MEQTLYQNSQCPDEFTMELFDYAWSLLNTDLLCNIHKKLMERKQQLEQEYSGKKHSKLIIGYSSLKTDVDSHDMIAVSDFNRENIIFSIIEDYSILRLPVYRFAEAMELILRDNDHKPGWKDANIETLFCQLDHQTSSVAIAITDNNHDEIVRHCVHLANYAMMIADRHAYNIGK